MADDGWQGRALDTVGGLGGFYVSATCVAGEQLRYVNGATATVDVGHAITRKAACNEDEHVIGGGARIGGLVDTGRLVVSAPYDGPDADSIPDDGWKAKAWNVGVLPKLVGAYAICLR